MNAYTQQPLRDKIFELEKVMKELPQVELKVVHHWVPGVYIRELHVPKGTTLVGKIHKYDQFHFLLKGELLVSIDKEVQCIKAPATILSKAGAKRVAYAKEDTVWLMVHGTDETDIAKIEDHFIAKSEQEWLEFCKKEPMLPLEGDVKCLT